MPELTKGQGSGELTPERLMEIYGITGELRVGSGVIKDPEQFLAHKETCLEYERISVGLSIPVTTSSGILSAWGLVEVARRSDPVPSYVAVFVIAAIGVSSIFCAIAAKTIFLNLFLKTFARVAISRTTGEKS